MKGARQVLKDVLCQQRCWKKLKWNYIIFLEPSKLIGASSEYKIFIASLEFRINKDALNFKLVHVLAAQSLNFYSKSQTHKMGISLSAAKICNHSLFEQISFKISTHQRTLLTFCNQERGEKYTQKLPNTSQEKLKVIRLNTKPFPLFCSTIFPSRVKKRTSNTSNEQRIHIILRAWIQLIRYSRIHIMRDQIINGINNSIKSNSPMSKSQKQMRSENILTENLQIPKSIILPVLPNQESTFLTFS